MNQGQTLGWEGEAFSPGSRPAWFLGSAADMVGETGRKL